MWWCNFFPVFWCVWASASGNCTESLVQNLLLHPSQSIFYIGELCGMRIGLRPSGRSSAGLLQLRRGEDLLTSPCTLGLIAPEGFHTLIAFESLNEGKVVHENLQDYLQVSIYSTSAREWPEEREHNRTMSSRSGESVHVSAFKTQISSTNDTSFSFTLSFTGYNTSVDGKCDGFERFRCRNDRCIWLHLRCNGYDNCGDRSDEVGCNQQDETKAAILRAADSIYIFVSLALLILILLLLAFIVRIVVWHRPRCPSSQRTGSEDSSSSTLSLNSCACGQSARAFENDVDTAEDAPPSYEEVMAQDTNRSPVRRLPAQAPVFETTSPTSTSP